MHFKTVVDTIMQRCKAIPLQLRTAWTDVVLRLTKNVVQSVDPNVRNGDSLDIRPYVKIKIIPGGSIDETSYVDGVVFRKSVMHKRMLAEPCCPKVNPRILILAGGLEFQRGVSKLSSLEVLIEQESKFIELLVEKVMLLKPDLILVGRSVARTAVEQFCSYDVAVMQNVKPHLLERIA
jgi:1-phosphatidylinositol-3-phosphate 5-kinase